MAERDYKKEYQKEKERDYRKKNKKLGVYVSHDLFEQFTQKAEDEQVSKNSLITKWIEEYVLGLRD